MCLSDTYGHRPNPNPNPNPDVSVRQLWAQLVESAELRAQASVNVTLGFDVSALTHLQAPLYRTRDMQQVWLVVMLPGSTCSHHACPIPPLHASGHAARLFVVAVVQARFRTLSHPMALTRFDFTGCESSGTERFKVKLEASGRIDGVVFWYDIILDPETRLSTGIDSGTAHVGAWGQAVKFLDSVVEVNAGGESSIVVVHGENGLDLRVDHRAYASDGLRH